MHNLTDRIAARIVIFIASFVLTSFIAPTFWLALLYSMLITLIMSIILSIIRRHKYIHILNFSEFLDKCILSGNDYVLGLVTKLIHFDNIQSKDNHITAAFKGKTVMVVNCLRFGAVGQDEIVKLHHLAMSHQACEIYMLARLLDRRSMAIANSFTDTKFMIISARKLYKLASHAKLIVKDNTPAIKNKLSFRTIIAIALSRNLAPKYLLTATILAIMSVFTPLKTYYLVMASIALVLAVLALCGISKNIAPDKLGIFSKSTKNSDDIENKTINKPLQK